MNLNLMVDTLNVITDKSQCQIQQMIIKNKSVSQKLKYLSMYVSEMKDQIYDWICSILSSGSNLEKVKTKVLQMKLKSSQQLARHKLHVLLKRKLNRLKKQSFMYSIDSHSNNFQQQTVLLDLQKSVLHIEKDLNIQQEQQLKFNISSIIQRGRMNLDPTNFKDDHNTSQISQYSIRNLNLSELNRDIGTQNQSVKLETQLLINRKEAQIKINSQIKNQKHDRAKQEIFKQNETSNFRILIQNQKVVQNFHKQNQTKIQKTMKKKKKSIYTTMGTLNNTRQDLLGNLLQQSYQSCIQTQKK